MKSQIAINRYYLTGNPDRIEALNQEVINRITEPVIKPKSIELIRWRLAHPELAPMADFLNL